MSSTTLQFELPAMPESTNRFAVAWRESKADWDAYVEDSKREGGLLLPAMAAKLASMSNQRVCQLMDDGRLTSFEHFDRKWISRVEFSRFLRSERSRGGRPKKDPS